MEPIILEKILAITDTKAFFIELKNGLRYCATSPQLVGDSLLFVDKYGENVAILCDSIVFIEKWRNSKVRQ